MPPDPTPGTFLGLGDTLPTLALFPLIGLCTGLAVVLLLGKKPGCYRGRESALTFGLGLCAIPLAGSSLMGVLAAVLVLCASGVASWDTGWLALLQGGVEFVGGLLPVGLALILAELLEKERKAGAILFGMGSFALVRLAAVLTSVYPGVWAWAAEIIFSLAGGAGLVFLALRAWRVLPECQVIPQEERTSFVKSKIAARLDPWQWPEDEEPGYDPEIDVLIEESPLPQEDKDGKAEE